MQGHWASERSEKISKAGQEDFLGWVGAKAAISRLDWGKGRSQEGRSWGRADAVTVF